MQNSQAKKYSLTYFLNKIPKTLVAQKGYAVTANNLETAKAFAQRKGLSGLLLTEMSDSRTTLYFSSKELIDIAVSMQKEHEMKISKKPASFFASIKRLFMRTA